MPESIQEESCILRIKTNIQKMLCLGPDTCDTH